jgi:hypothetical protein
MPRSVNRRSLRQFATLLVLPVIAGLVIGVALYFSSDAGAPARTVTTRYSFPSGVSADHRYLIDQRGKPYMIVGDSAWSLSTNLTPAEMATYFANRQVHGFNTVLVGVLTDSYINGIGGDTMRTYDGIKPFTTGDSDSNYDLSTPNPAYFARIETVVHTAARYGITVMLDPAETGDLVPLLVANGVKKDREYGVYLGRRFGRDPNVMWSNGNDFGGYSDAADDAAVQAVAEGIESVDRRQIETVELYAPATTSLDDPSWAPLINLNLAYTYYMTYAAVLHGRNQTPTTPVFMGESNYEGEDNTGINFGSPYELRLEEYWTMTSGATGLLYGNHYTWDASSWSQEAGQLNSPGAAQIDIMQKFFQALHWYALVPDQGHTFVTAGYGTFSSTGVNASNNYVSAALTEDGRLGVAYLPQAATISVDTAKLSGTVTARWFDPTTGRYTTIGRFPNSGTRQFSSPPDHEDGQDDWVLLLQAR